MTLKPASRTSPGPPRSASRAAFPSRNAQRFRPLRSYTTLRDVTSTSSPALTTSSKTEPRRFGGPADRHPRGVRRGETRAPDPPGLRTHTVRHRRDDSCGRIGKRPKEMRKGSVTVAAVPCLALGDLRVGGHLFVGAQAAVSPGRFGCGRKPPVSVARAPWI
jgi:hypothetical protein